jgi:hypothetical protein
LNQKINRNLSVKNNNSFLFRINKRKSVQSVTLHLTQHSYRKNTCNFHAGRFDYSHKHTFRIQALETNYAVTCAAYRSVKKKDRRYLAHYGQHMNKISVSRLLKHLATVSNINCCT